MALSARDHSKRSGRDVVDDGGFGRELSAGRRARNQEAPSVDERRTLVDRAVERREPVGPEIDRWSTENAVVLPAWARNATGSTVSMSLRLSVARLLQPTYGRETAPLGNTLPAEQPVAWRTIRREGGAASGAANPAPLFTGCRHRPARRNAACPTASGAPRHGCKRNCPTGRSSGRRGARRRSPRGAFPRRPGFPS